MILHPLRHGRFGELSRLVSRLQVSTSIRLGLAIASFIIYAVAVMMLREHRHSEYKAEAFELAAAISNVTYGAPIGTIYSGLLTPFVYKPIPIRQAMEETARGPIARGPLLMVNPVGSGITYTVITTLAMRLFGLHLSSLTFALLGLMGISVFVFLLRYRDDRVFVVPLYFFSLTVMLFTPLMTDAFLRDQIPVGGIHYFTLLAILPAMHIFWEIVEPAKTDALARAGNFILLGVQMLVLAVVILARGSAGYLVGALTVAFFAALGKWRGDPAGIGNLLRKGTFIAIVSALIVACFYLSVPQAYKESGRTTGLLWHRVLLGFGANPAWPFGNLRDVYSACMRYEVSREGLVSGSHDANGGCIWEAYAFEHGLTPAEMVAGIYSGRYEAVIKKAVLGIVRTYPMEVFETLVYYKPLRILSSMRTLIEFGAPGKTPGIKLLLLALALAQASALAAFVVFGASGEPKDHMRLLIRALLLFAICDNAPYFVARAEPRTAAELLFYIVAGLAVALIAVFEATRRSPRANPNGRASG